MSYFAAALVRRGSEWSGEELDLDDVEDLDGIVDAMRAAAGDEPSTVLLLLEEDDEWFAVVRMDEDADPRVFVSDARVVETSTLGAILCEAAAVVDEPDEVADPVATSSDDDDESLSLNGEPIGDPDLLKDLGTPADRLLALSAEEGQLPADIITALCEKAGCLEPLESLRG